MLAQQKRINKYKTAILEASRFQFRAREALKELETNENVFSSKLNASAKRASMDLTRALAEIRKSDY